MRLRLARIVIAAALTVVLSGLTSEVYCQTILSSGQGQSVFQSLQNSKKSLKKLSLLDPERFTMKNQYLMSFSSVGGGGSLMGMYINTMEYRFNCPVVMRLKVAYQSKTGSLFGSNNAFTGNPNYQNGRVFIPSFDVIYKPWKNTSISFHYRDYSSGNPYSGYYGYDRYSRYSRYGFSPYIGY